MTELVKKPIDIWELAPVSLYKTMLGAIFFILKGQPRSQTTPETVGSYRLISQAEKKLLSGNFGIGIYESNGTRVFIKTWRGRVKDSYYYSLVNECVVGNVIREVLARTTYKHLVSVPEILEVIKTKDSLSVVFQYVEGKELNELPSSEQIPALTNVLHALTDISATLTTGEQKYFAKRTVAFHFFSSCIAAGIVAWRYPSYTYSLIRGLSTSFSSMLRLRTVKLSLAHGELSLENLIVKDGVAYMVDCGGVAFSPASYDETCLALNPDIPTLQSQRSVENSPLIENYILLHSVVSHKTDISIRDHYLQMIDKGVPFLSRQSPSVSSVEQKHFSVTIGIPAYNEERNIAKLLEEILSQERKSFTIDEIIVVSDGSDDRTVLEASRYSQVRVLDDGQRKGKALRMNDILRRSQSDIVVILDADITLAKDAIEQLLRPFALHPDTMLVSGTMAPFSPKTFTEQIAFVAYYLWDTAVRMTKNAEMYHCGGPMRAFRKPFYETLNFPIITADDVYPYVVCKLQNHRFDYVPNVLGRYKLPSTLADFIKQQKRFLSSGAERETVFGDKVAATYETIKTQVKIKALCRTFVKFPLATIAYFILWIQMKISTVTTARATSQAVWDPVMSTK